MAEASDKGDRDLVGAGKVLLVGLGNPGPKYTETRHNIGFVAVERMAARHAIDISRTKFKAQLGAGLLGNRTLVCLLPQTFMNLSGQSVGPAMTFYTIAPGQVVVVHDDIDLPFGAIRLKRGGGHGGHNGLRDIDRQLGTNDYFRVRVGVGRPARGDVKDYVLQRFADDERPWVGDLADRTCDAITALLEDGLKAAQSRFNGPLPGYEPPAKAG